MNCKREYERWLSRLPDGELKKELEAMDDAAVEDAFYRELTFGTGGLRGILGVGTNRMNVYVVAKASQGLSRYLTDRDDCPSVVIGYDTRIKSDVFSEVAACVFAANGVKVFLWPEPLPVPMVSYAVRYLKCSAGVMITASHNPSEYNGYKVYGSDGCQITTDAAAEIFERISSVDIFDGVRATGFDEGIGRKMIAFIEPAVFTGFIEEAKKQSVLFGDEIDRKVSIVYSPLNGTGIKPVLRVLEESGFTSVAVVEEQREPDGSFPTCPYPNPEVREAMELGLQYCSRIGADLLIATDPDADRCGIAVRQGTEYKLLSGNEVGVLLLDFICAQRKAHGKMPDDPVFIKTIVTTDLAERIADSYGVRTINVLTGFKFIGEMIGRLEKQGNTDGFICGFEESYGYLTGTYVRDKDAVNAVIMICEMFAFYKTRGVTLFDKLDELYSTYGYCLNTLHSYEFDGSAGMEKMKSILSVFREGVGEIAGWKIERTEDYIHGLNGLPPADVLKYTTAVGTVVIRPSGTEPKLKTYVSVTAKDNTTAKDIEKKISAALVLRMK